MCTVHSMSILPWGNLKWEVRNLHSQVSLSSFAFYSLSILSLSCFPKWFKTLKYLFATTDISSGAQMQLLWFVASQEEKVDCGGFEHTGCLFHHGAFLKKLQGWFFTLHDFSTYILTLNSKFHLKCICTWVNKKIWNYI